MKAHTTEAVLETFGVRNASDFKIRANGKAFRILIDGLYSNKIESCVRELTTNAFDSCKRAGQTKPFYVHAPDYAIGEFYVRDYGIGMDHDTVTHLYTTLFESDKDASNDEAGMLGLGSKSPFAYTDQFFVHAYDGSTVRNYICAIGPNGVPQLLFHGREDSDEPRGVKIGFAVKPDDFSRFSTAIKSLAFGFDPIFESNIPDLKSCGTVTPVLSGTDWRAFSPSDFAVSSNHRNNRWFVRQGCVIYPITGQDDLSIPHCNRFNYLLDMPIGTVGVTASREAVEYTDITTDAIRDRIRVVEQEISDKIEEEVKDIPSVEAFFNAVNAKKPSWLTRPFVHGPTGLSTTTVKLEERAVIFQASKSDRDIRWDYTFNQIVRCSDANTEEYLFVTDVDKLFESAPPKSLDKDRAYPQFFQFERRRLARLARAYCEAHGLDDVNIAFGFDWTDEFWKAVLPYIKRRAISVKDLKDCVPKRAVSAPIQFEGDAPKPTIRGLALAKVGGEQTPLDGLPAANEHSAWIPSENWRRQYTSYWKLAQRFGVKKLYIASPTAEVKIKETGVPTLRDFIASKVREHGLTEKQFATLVDGTDYYIEKVLRIASQVRKDNPDLYNKVLRAKGLLSQGFKVMKPYVDFSNAVLAGSKFDSAEIGGLKELFSNTFGAEAGLDQNYKDYAGVIYGNTSHYVYKLIEMASGYMEEDKAKGTIETILCAQRNFPDYAPQRASRY